MESTAGPAEGREWQPHMGLRAQATDQSIAAPMRLPQNQRERTLLILKFNALILQMRKLRPREGKRTCPGSHSKFVVEPGTESMSPRLCPFPVPQFPSLL